MCLKTLLNKHVPTWLFFFLFLNISASYASNLKTNWFHLRKIYYDNAINHWYYRMGDDSSWSNIDSEWQLATDKTHHQYHPDIQWYYAFIQLDGEFDNSDVIAITLHNVVSACEVYWDGIKIGQNGIVAKNSNDEVAGELHKIFKVKRDYTRPGLHRLTIRLSNFHTRIKNPISRVGLGYHYNIHHNYVFKNSHLLFTGGALLIACLFCVALFFAGNRHRSYLLFSLYCLISLFFDIYPTIQLYNPVQVELLPLINFMFAYGNQISLFFLAIFVIFTFEIPRKIIFIIAAIILSLISSWLRSLGMEYSFYYNEIIPLFSLGLLSYSLMKRTTGSIAAFAGLLIWRLSKYTYILLFMKHYYFHSIISGEIFFLFCIVLSVMLKINRQEKLLQEIQLRSSRLEVDLLKKNIQPHFILNTLQSIMSWIKKKPDNAVQLIEALADEFKGINQVSDKKLIPLHQEIDLCRIHLKLMGFRMGSEYDLVVEGTCEDDLIPPMLFHTLVENALTHSFKTHEAGTIRLLCMKSEKKIEYQLTNNGSRLKEISTKSESDIQEGMGIKYIKARLQESFTDKWQLNYKLNDEEWLVQIIINQ